MSSSYSSPPLFSFSTSYSELLTFSVTRRSAISSSFHSWKPTTGLPSYRKSLLSLSPSLVILTVFSCFVRTPRRPPLRPPRPPRARPFHPTNCAPDLAMPLTLLGVLPPRVRPRPLPRPRPRPELPESAHVSCEFPVPTIDSPLSPPSPFFITAAYLGCKVCNKTKYTKLLATSKR
ncbi:hypothetical protein Hanom_Chr16g01459731 [Helianthus anomalus]